MVNPGVVGTVRTGVIKNGTLSYPPSAPEPPARHWLKRKSIYINTWQTRNRTQNIK